MNQLAKKPDAIMDILAKNQKAIKSILPKHLTPERVLRIAYMTINSSSKLRECHPISIMNAVIEASKLGLEIGSHAHIVPFKTQAQLIVDYKGYIALAYRSDMVSSFYFHPVYAGDVFKYTLGLRKDLIHEPGENRGQLKAAYACIHFKNGGSDFEVILPEDAELTKARSAGAKYKDSPWHGEDEWIMWCKTAVRRLAKRIPQSPDFQRAAFLEEMVMAGMTQPNLISSVKPEGTDLSSVDINARLKETAKEQPQQESSTEWNKNEGSPVDDIKTAKKSIKNATGYADTPQAQPPEPQEQTSSHPWDHKNWKGLKSGFGDYLMQNKDTIPESLIPALRKKWNNIKSLASKPFPLDVDANTYQSESQAENVESEANGEVSEQFTDASEIENYPPIVRKVAFELAELNNCLPEEVSPRVINSSLKTKFPDQWEAVRQEKNFGYMPTTDEGAVFWNIAIGNKVVEDDIPF